MMIFMHFTFQSIFLAAGFGVGYWLLITANTQEDNLKTVGRVLGWLLITLAILFSLFSLYFSLELSNPRYMPVGFQEEMPAIDNEISPEDSEKQTFQRHKDSSMQNNENSDEMEDTLPENKDMSVKKDKETND